MSDSWVWFEQPLNKSGVTANEVLLQGRDLVFNVFAVRSRSYIFFETISKMNIYFINADNTHNFTTKHELLRILRFI